MEPVLKQVDETIVEKQEVVKPDMIKFEHLRFIDTNTIDSMMKFVYNSTKEAFDLYFALASIKANKIKEKTKEDDKS
jgi:hypothetical protein